MKLIEVKTIAKSMGIKPSKMKKEELIRCIQQAESNPQCFNTGAAAQCDQDECLWREDCV